MSSIPSNTPVGPNTNQYTSDVNFDPKKAGIGSGAIGQAGDAPPPVPQETVANALASLTAFMSGGAGIDVDVLLVQIAVAMRDTEATNQKAKINTDQESKKLQLKEKEEKLQEAQKKLDEAEAKRKSASIWDKIKLAFEWIGAAIAIALAAVMIATGVGAVVGGLLIAAAITAIIMAIDSTVSHATGMGMAGHAAYAVAIKQGKTEEEAKEAASKADMGFRIALAVVGIALAIASGGAGIVSSVKSAVDAGRTVAQGIKEAFTLANQMLSQGAKLARQAISIAETANMVGSAVTNAGSSATRSEATKLSGEAKQIEAQTKTDEALIQMLDDLIDQALSRLMASSDRFNTILDDIVEAMNDRGNTMSKARFAG